MALAVAVCPQWLYAGVMGRQPTRIHPQSGDGESRSVTFRDGPQLLPDVFAGLADADSYPDLTYQEWIHRVANKKIEARTTSRAVGLARAGHFA